MKKFLASVIYIALLSACNESADRPEQITKLRTLGVKTVPAVYSVNNPKDITLTLYMISPSDSQLTYESFADEESLYARNIEMTLNTNQDLTPEPHAALNIFSIQATIPVSSIQEKLEESASNPNFRYGFLIRQGNEEEKVVGNIVGGQEEQAGLDQIEIISPAAGEVAGEVGIEGQLPETTQPYRISWLASGGEIANRRSISTIWKQIPDSPQTLILTARSMKTGDFAFSVRDFNSTDSP